MLGKDDEDVECDGFVVVAGKLRALQESAASNTWTFLAKLNQSWIYTVIQA